jgi:hypothetical protein
LVVSEETGAISIAFDAGLYYDLSTVEITRKLKELLDKGSRRFDHDDAALSSYAEHRLPVINEREGYLG